MSRTHLRAIMCRSGWEIREEVQGLRVAHFGTFDVENYGDLLFPLILENRLSDLCDEVIHVSPAGGPPPWGDCVPTVGFDDFLRDTPELDGVVVGGGQILRSSHTPLETYDRGGVTPFTAYPSLWLGAAYIAAREDVPLCWNAPGVAGALPPVASQLARWTASVTDYPSVRDEMSRAFLREASIGQQVSVVPDTAIEVGRLWTEAELSEAYADAFTARGREVPERTIAFHVNRRWAGEGPSSVAARVDRISARLEATPVMIAIGPCHGDDELQRQITRAMEAEPLIIERPRSLREVAACIARSEAYLGSSLHGMITALSFGNPGVLVAGGEDPKYDGFLDHFELSPWRAKSWEEAEQRADDLLAAPRQTRERVPGTAEPALERHWERIRETLAPGRAAGDRRAAIERLPRISEESFGGIDIFQGIIAESLADRQARLAGEIQKRKELRQRLDQESQKLRESRERLDQESQKLREEREKSRRLEAEKEQLQQAWAGADRDVDRLVHWTESLYRDISAMRDSRRWQAGQALAKLDPRGASKPGEPEVTERLDETFERFHAWRRERRATDEE